MAEPLQSPYVKGNTLTLNIKSVGKKSPLQLEDGGNVQAKIVDVVEPATMSVIIIVELEASLKQRDQAIRSATAPKMVLKVYDRRFSSGLREELSITDPTQTTEEKFLTFLREGSMAEFEANYNNDPTYTSDNWDSSMEEAHLSLTCARMKNTETRVYDCLVDLQGIHIPTFYADIQIVTGMAAGEQQDQSLTAYTEVRAILIEYIPGFLLSDLVTETPESKWPAICNQAIAAANKIIGHNFINNDLQPRNSIVRYNETKDSYRVFYIDFGLCDFRDPSDTDEVWRERKRQKGEETRVGGSLANAISRAKGKKGKKYKGSLPLPWEFTPSNRFEEEYIELYPNSIYDT